jgi:multiple sugar transport system substrate-binding protein
MKRRPAAAASTGVAPKHFSRRTFLCAVGSMGGAALTSGLLGACGSTASPAGDKEVVKLLWSDVTHAYAPLLADFTSATGIEVMQTIVPYNQRLDKINTAVLGGGDFDLVQMDTVWTPQFAAAGWVEDVTDRITAALKGDVSSTSLSAVTYKGKLYGVPLFNSAKHLFYNEQLLKEAGFEHPPPTLDDLVAQAKATTRPGRWGSIWSWKQSEALLCDWLSIMFTRSGAQILDSDGKAVFNLTGGTEALHWMVELLYTHKAADPASLECTEDDVRKALQTGVYALTYNWEGVLPEANNPAKSKAAPSIRVALLPGGTDVKSASVNGSEAWAILAHSQHKAAAWKLLRYMASPSWQKRAAMITGNYPILASLYDDPELLQQIRDFPIYGEQFRHLVVRPQLVSYAQASDIIQKHLHRALLQKTGPKDAMDAAVDEVNKATAAP